MPLELTDQEPEVRIDRARIVRKVNALSHVRAIDREVGLGEFGKDDVAAGDVAAEAVDAADAHGGRTEASSVTLQLLQAVAGAGRTADRARVGAQDLQPMTALVRLRQMLLDGQAETIVLSLRRRRDTKVADGGDHESIVQSMEAFTLAIT